MGFYEMLNHLEDLNGSLDKEAYLIHILKHVRNAEAFFRFAFNDQVFGVKEATFINAFPEYQNDYEHISNWLEEQESNFKHEKPETVADLIKFGNHLLTVSGDKMQFDIANWFGSYLSPLQKKWFCRAILKDLRCGVQVKTVNKAFKYLGLKTIDKFAMQLCDKIDLYNEDEVKRKLTFPCTMECKYDGIRIQAEVWEEDGEMFATMTSRRGKDRTDLYPEIIEALKETFSGQHVILDGEVISRSFQSLMTKDDTNQKKLVVWDILNDELLPYKDRWSNLYSLCEGLGITVYNGKTLNNINNQYIFTAEHYSCNSIQEAQDYYEFLNERGEEGIIIKLDSRPYERGTRKHMFKCKKVLTADLLCIGYKLGEGKRSGKVATLELIDASGKIRSDVGSGIDDAMCEELTLQLNEVEEANMCREPGEHEIYPDFYDKIVEIKYNEITETQSLRNPRFVSFRDDKDIPDDLSEAEVRQA